MYRLSPVLLADRGVVDVTARFGDLEVAVARANECRARGVPVRVRKVTRAGMLGDFVGGAQLVPVAGVQRRAA